VVLLLFSFSIFAPTSGVEDSEDIRATFVSF